jgi:hypothetical protein
MYVVSSVFFFFYTEHQSYSLSSFILFATSDIYTPLHVHIPLKHAITCLSQSYILL